MTAAAEFRSVYPIYVGNFPVAEKRLKDELEHNAEFRRFLEVRYNRTREVMFVNTTL